MSVGLWYRKAAEKSKITAVVSEHKARRSYQSYSTLQHNGACLRSRRLKDAMRFSRRSAWQSVSGILSRVRSRIICSLPFPIWTNWLGRRMNRAGQ